MATNRKAFARWREQLKRDPPKGDDSTEEDGLAEPGPEELKRQRFLQFAADGTVIRQLRKVRSQAEMRSMLMSAVTEDELLEMKDMLVRIATDPKHRNNIKAIALLWAYVMGRPDQDVNLSVAPASQPLTEAEKRQKVLSVIQSDRTFQDPEFRKQILQTLSDSLSEKSGTVGSGVNEHGSEKIQEEPSADGETARNPEKDVPPVS